MIHREFCVSFTFPYIELMKFTQFSLSKKAPNWLNWIINNFPRFHLVELLVKSTEVDVGGRHWGSVEHVEILAAERTIILIAAQCHTITTAVSQRRGLPAIDRTFIQRKEMVDKQMHIYYMPSILWFLIHAVVTSSV